jgi:hypothetical protein
MLGALCASMAAICATMRRAAPFASEACFISCTASLLACLLRAGPLVGEALSCLAAQMTMACMQRGGLHEQLQLLFDMLCTHCKLQAGRKSLASHFVWPTYHITDPVAWIAINF